MQVNIIVCFSRTVYIQNIILIGLQSNHQNFRFRVKCSVLVSAIFDVQNTVMYLTSKLSCSRHNTWCTRIKPATSGLPLYRLIQQTTNSLIFFFFYFPEDRKTGYVIPCHADNLHECQICFFGKLRKMSSVEYFTVKICTNNSHMSVHNKTYKNWYDETDQPAHQ